MRCARLLMILALVTVTAACTYTRRDPQTGEEQVISRREYEALRREKGPAYSGASPQMRPVEKP